MFQCSKDVSSAGIQYVQPVAVVPVGGPVPAVQAGGQYTVPLASQDSLANRDFSVASHSHTAPTNSFGPPHSPYNPPTSGNVPTAGYRGPKTGIRKIDNSELYQTQFSSAPAEQARPVRSGRVEEGYCVPVAQCPANKILGNSPQKDYSKLINPRVKNKYISPAGRSSLELDVTEQEEDEEEEGSGQETTTTIVEELEAAREISRKRRENEEDAEPLEKVMRRSWKQNVSKLLISS